ncbi:MAG: ABC transporter ATP-binding protein [Chloroflexota bacterium]
MRVLSESLSNYRPLWRAWLPLVVMNLVGPVAMLAMPIIEKSLVDDVILARDIDKLVPTMGLYTGLWVLMTIIQAINVLSNTYLFEQLTLRLRQRLFAHADALSLTFSHREHSGRTMSLFSNDVPAVAGLMSSTVFGALGAAFTLILSALFMFGMSLQLALVVAVVPPVVGGLAWIFTRPLRPAARRVQDKAAEISQRIQENLSGLREVVAFGQEKAQSSGFATAQRELQRLRIRLAVMDQGIQTGQTLLSLVMTLVILGYGGYLVIKGEVSLGTLFAIRTLFSFIYTNVGQLFGTVANAQRAMGAADRVYEFLDEKPAVVERESAHRPVGVRGAISFEGVSFAYQPGRPVLRDVTFDVPPGELVALVGPSGAGKSTIASLITRFYDPSAGRVLLDGVDLRDLTLEGLREQIGMVFQDSFLFATTIGENIAIGRDGATPTEVEAAARAAHAWEFVAELPAGLQTQVGQRGVQLSEGQKQRLAIARALLRNPRILILDEPTTALDARSEHLVQAALENLMRGRTTFVIAHRLATIRRADRILVVEHGQLVQQGRHAELLQQGGLYRELFELQFGTAAVGLSEAPSTHNGSLLAAAAVSP